MTEDHNGHDDGPAVTSTDTKPTDHPAARLLEPAKDGQPSTDAEAETDIWVGRTHWKHYAGRLLLWLVGNIVFAVLFGWVTSRFEAIELRHALWTIAGVFLVSGAAVVGPVVATILGRHYRLTSQRLFIRRGILSQTVDQTELIRVDDVRIHKTFLDRMLGLGSVAIVSTDATDRDILVEGIKEPEKVAEAVRSSTRALRRKSLFVETL